MVKIFTPTENGGTNEIANLLPLNEYSFTSTDKMPAKTERHASVANNIDMQIWKS